MADRLTRRGWTRTAMRAVEDPGGLRVLEQRPGTLLRLGATGSDAREAARDLLGVLVAELEGEIAGGARRRDQLQAKDAVLVQLESLQVELTVDGDDVLIRHAGGSPEEFDDLCEFIGEQADRG